MSSVLDCISHVPISWQSKCWHLEMASCWTLPEHPPCSHIWHACQPCYTPQRHQPHPLWIICTWTCLPSSRAPKLVQALSIGTKVKLSKVVPFCCISLKSSNAFSCCPTLTYILKAFYSTKNCPIVECMVPWKLALLPPMGSFVGPQANVHHSYSYAWNKNTLHSPSPIYNPTIVKDLKRIDTKVSLLVL